MELEHVFGLRGELKGSIKYLDDNTVVYPCGDLVVLYHIDTKLQNFIMCAESHGSIERITVSLDGKMIAVCEKSDIPKIHIYDVASLRKKKTILCNEAFEIDDILAMAFTADSKQLAVLGDGVHWNIGFWSLDKKKSPVIMAPFEKSGGSIHSVVTCPWDASVFCIMGDNILKFYRLNDTTFKKLPFLWKGEPLKYSCLAWLSDKRTVIGTSTGDLLLFENFEFRKTLVFENDEASTNASLDVSPILAIVPYNRGFICGSVASSLRFFEIQEEGHDYYTLAKTHSIDSRPCSVLSMEISPSEDSMVFSMSNNQIYYINLSNTDYVGEVLKVDRLGSSVHGPYIPRFKFSSMMSSSSSEGQIQAKITGLDTCVSKPWVVTCGIDHVVRVWNYIEKTVELEKEFSSEPTCVSLHPSGLYLLIGFVDNVCLAATMLDRIQIYKELSIRDCSGCKFSPGGNFFALVVERAIHVFKTYTCEIHAVLRGHASSVTSISWAQNDQILVSTDTSGNFLRWKMSNGSFDTKFTNDEGELVAGCHINDNCSWISSSAGNLLEIDHKRSKKIFQLHSDSENKITKIIGSKAFPFAYVAYATLTSSSQNSQTPWAQQSLEEEDILGAGIARLPVPLSSLVESPKSPSNQAEVADIEEDFVRETTLELSDLPHLKVHSQAVSHMCMSHDNQYLFTAGDDGMLAVFAITADPDAKSRKNAPAEPASAQFHEEVLVSRTELEERNKEWNELDHKAAELKLHGRYQIRQNDLQRDEEIESLTKKHIVMMKRYDEDAAQLESEMKEIDTAFEERLKIVEEEQQAETSRIEKTYEKKIQAESERFEALVIERTRVANNWQKENEKMIAENKLRVDSTIEDYEQRIATERALWDTIEAEKYTLQNELSERRGLFEQNADTELDEVKDSFSEQLRLERESKLRLRGENGIMKKKYGSLTNELQEKREKLRAVSETYQRMSEREKILEKDISSHKKEIRERDDTIQEKEHKIFDLKKKNQELEKFKFVLDYKIKELNEQIEPREQEIKKMSEQMHDMRAEQTEYKKNGTALKLMVDEMKMKIAGLQKEVSQQEIVLDTQRQSLGEFKGAIGDTSAVFDKPAELSAMMTKLYRKYCNIDASKLSQPKTNKIDLKKEVGKQAEYTRQRNFLEKNAELLEAKALKNRKAFEAEKIRMLQESSELMNAINDLRRELTSLTKSARLEFANAPPSSTTNNGVEGFTAVEPPSAKKEIEIQRRQIQTLKAQIGKLQMP